MNYNIESINSYTKRAQFSFVDESIPGKIEKELKKIGQEVQIKGFRKGKAPFSLISKFYRGEADARVFDDLINQKVRELIDDTKVKLVKPAEVAELKVNAEKGEVSFTVILEVFPEFNLKDFMDYDIKMEEVIITDEDITNFKQDVLRAESELVSVDKPLDTNMLAVIDLQGWQGHQLSKLCWQEHYYSMSDSALLPQLTATLIGKKKGDSFECQQKIADTFYMEEVRGADLRLQGEIKDVLEYRLPEFDDKLVSRYGFKSVEDFNNRIGVVMQYRKDEECGRKFLNEFLAKVVADNTIELPASMLKTTADRILEEINDKNRYYGKTSKVDTKDLDSTARQSLATALVYAKLLQQYELTVEQSEVDEYLAKADEVFGRDHANEESSRTNEEMSKICETVMEKKLVATLKSAIAARRAVL